MRTKLWRGRDKAVVTGSFLALFALGGAGIGGLHALGLPLLPKPEPVVKSDPEPRMLDWALTPSYLTFNQLLNPQRTNWTPTGPVVMESASQLPASCVKDLGGSVGSVSRGFEVDGVAVDVTLSAFGPGVGPSAIRELRRALSGCGRGQVKPLDLGLDGFTFDTSIGGVPTSNSIWRRGDVLAYVSSTNPTEARSVVDQDLLTVLPAVCTNLEGSVDDVTRNPWVNRDIFTGLTETVPTSVLPFARPRSDDARITQYPAPDVSLSNVSVPKKPSYPVWPPLPVVVEKPASPSVPVKPGNTSSILASRVDPVGPGCGWEFTGVAVPNYDQKSAAAKEKADIKASQEALRAGGRAWQTGVTDYYRAYGDYLNGVDAYNTYTSQVEEVRTAWNAIGVKWDAYYAAKRDYDRQVAARDNFLSRSRTAQNNYDRALAACQAEPTTVTETPRPAPTTTTITPSPTPTTITVTPEPTPTSSTDPDGNTVTSTPSPTPTTTTITPSPTPTTITVTPEPTPTTRVVPPPACPTRPSILDQTAPEVGNPPVTPPDPRPVDQR